jgi:DNA-binding protein HU-beta
MKSVTRQMIARQVSLKTGLSWLDVNEVVKHALDTIAQNISEGKVVQLRNLGTFEFRERPGRIRFNPQNPEDKVEVPAHFVVIFSPTTQLKIAARKLREDQVTATGGTFAARKRMRARK